MEHDQTAEVAEEEQHAFVVVPGNLAMLVAVRRGSLVVMVDMWMVERRLIVLVEHTMAEWMVVAAVVHRKVLARAVLRLRRCLLAVDILQLLGVVSKTW